MRLIHSFIHRHLCWLTDCRINCSTEKHCVPKRPGFSLLRPFLVAFVVVESIDVEEPLLIQQHQVCLQCIYFANRSFFPSREILPKEISTKKNNGINFRWAWTTIGTIRKRTSRYWSLRAMANILREKSRFKLLNVTVILVSWTWPVNENFPLNNEEKNGTQWVEFAMNCAYLRLP